MRLQVYDSLTRKKQLLLAAEGQESVSLYVCGPTVYQRVHIGNARPYVTFVLFARYLRSLGLQVKLVSNITDVNDKIYVAAKEAGIASSEMARRATEWYLEDTNRLGIGRPDHEPLATEAIPEIVALISELIERGLAYEAGGDVYYRVEKFAEYGRLSNQQPEQMLEGSRVEPGEGKERPLDFALWKRTKYDEDTSWDSPWGRGRPGWHIECSAMAEQLLGQSFDVHGGGLDLIFPHHENEYAQSRGAGRPFARLWMHNGMLELAGEKMSKSTGNIATLREVLDQWPTWVVLLYFFSGSYRNPLEFSDAALEEARARGTRITEALRRAERYLKTVQVREAGDPGYSDPGSGWEGLHEALHNDFNMSEAMSVLFGLIWDINTGVNERATPQLVRNARATVIEFLELFGLHDLVPVELELPVEVQQLLDQRELARSKKKFEEADQLREDIRALGYVVRDTDDGIDIVPVDDAGDSGARSERPPGTT